MSALPSPSAGPAAVTRPLGRRYLIAFVIAAGLLLLNQLLVQPPLLRLANDAPVINVAGRQRMLSQKLTKAALALVAAETDAERSARRDELREVLDLWSHSHDTLRGTESLSTSGGNSPRITEAFAEIEPFYGRMRAAAGRLIASPDPTAGRDAVNALLANESEFLDRMDRIVALYEEEARDRAAGLRSTGWIISGFVVLALAAVGGFVLVPATRVIERQVADLRAARDRLEDRVRERTAELEASHRELEAVHGERLAAEERHRRLLEQLGHAARVNTMGEMATGLAHELNQPLGAITNYVGGCLEQLDAGRTDPSRLRGALERAQEATLRAGEIVRRVRRFATRHEFQAESVDPARLASETVDFLRDEAARREITLEIEAAPDLPSVSGDPVQLQQVLVNLIRNSFDAVNAAEAAPDAKPRRGNVIVSVGRSPDGNVSFAVIDNGEGLPAERKDKMFDPFFSTRAGGMGMGLAISRGIVEAHHGKIAAESDPGVRTCIRFTLPAREGA